MATLLTGLLAPYARPHQESDHRHVTSVINQSEMTLSSACHSFGETIVRAPSSVEVWIPIYRKERDTNRYFSCLTEHLLAICWLLGANKLETGPVSDKINPRTACN